MRSCAAIGGERPGTILYPTTLAVSFGINDQFCWFSALQFSSHLLCRCCLSYTTRDSEKDVLKHWKQCNRAQRIQEGVMALLPFGGGEQKVGKRQLKV